MNNLTENNIIDALRNLAETPSDSCWQSIANNLPPTLPANSPTNSPQSPQSGLNHFINSLTGKIITALTSVATIATISTLIIVNQNDNQNNDLNVTTVSAISDTNIVVSDVKSPVNQRKLETNEGDLTLPTITDVTPTEFSIEKKDAKNNSFVENQSNPISYSGLSPVQNSSNKKPESSRINEENMDNVSEVPESIEPINEVETQIVQSLSSESVDLSLLKRPNVFTPNGDGYNDFLVFENIEIFPKNRLIVINANGSKVYERNQYDNSWNASNLPDGAYFYILEINNGLKTVSIYGSIQIIR